MTGSAGSSSRSDVRARVTRRDRVDDEARSVYGAEDAVDAEIGPDLSRWADLVTWTAAVLDDDRVRDRFPTLPEDVRIGRRSRTATASVASASAAAIAIRDGSRSALVVLHELAHLIEPADPSHGRRFREALVELVRVACGIEAAAALRHAYATAGLDV